jgi:NADH-quinone oxidoreductase subunit I
MSVWGLFASLLPFDLAQGLGVTGKYLMRRKVTVQYPDKKQVPADRFRGMFGFSEERCIVCYACAKACPIDIIHIQDHFEEIEVDGKKKKKKVLDRYDIDVKRCMFCGLCEEACPTEPPSIWLTSKTYEGAVYERNDGLYFDKQRLFSWQGVQAFPGVRSPAEGQDPKDPMGRKPKTEAAATDVSGEPAP